MLLLHGLHPDDFETRVRRVTDRLRPHLGVHGLRLEVMEIARRTVRLRVSTEAAAEQSAPPYCGRCQAKLRTPWWKPRTDVERILIDGLDVQEAAAAIRAAE